MTHAQLAELSWDDLFQRTFPGERSAVTTSRQLPGVCFAEVRPTAVRAPRLLAWSREAGALLDLAEPAGAAAEAAAQILSGNELVPGARPYAAGYGGHQFGTWAGQLGDGRAITLGEVIGAGAARWEVQLKGAGPTPYSRRSDGRAVLRSSIREFLCSEAMAHLGVPSTRALSLVATGDPVTRDMFYDGRPRAEPGAIVCRLAPTFVRFGTFELLAWRDEHELLRRMIAFVIAEHFPELEHQGGDDASVTPALIARWYTEVCKRTAVMIAHWMRVGFVHGVMNTDNMSILGLTLDYGPYGWLDVFDPDFTPNTTDAATGRYRFGMQPGIAQWNLAHLARALASLCPERADQEALAAALDTYRTTFERSYGAMMRAKLGLVAGGAPGQDEALINDLLALLAAHDTDPTWFFRGLAEVPSGLVADARSDGDRAARAALAPLVPALYGEAPPAHLDKLLGWLRRYVARRDQQPGGDAERRRVMAAANPIFLLRNYLVQQAIARAERALSDGAADDASAAIAQLLEAARSPYREGPEHAGLLDKRPDWARDAPGCGALSCST